MRFELINTGSELLLGFTINTHVNYLARQLATIGRRFTRQTTVSDDRAEMRALLVEALARSDVILITGGLGPTSDDFTRDVVAELCDRPLVRDEAVAAAISDRFRKRGIHKPRSVEVQSLVPVGATVLPNPHGTAPGLFLTHAGCRLYLLPGPPRELKPMFEQHVLPQLPAVAALDCRVLKVAGLGESQVEEKVAPVLADLPGLELGYCARMGEVEVRLIADPGTNEVAEQRVRAALGEAIYGRGDERLEDVVVRALAAAGQMVATAESCTGGLLANRLTNVPGSSAVFRTGWVTYHDEAKQRELGVRAETLAQHGAVSEAVAREMAEGARQRSGADYGLSATGIAGPGGGSAEKPVGLVFVALATPARTIAVGQQWLLDRESFKFFVAQTALDLLRRELLAAAGRCVDKGVGFP